MKLLCLFVMGVELKTLKQSRKYFIQVLKKYLLIPQVLDPDLIKHQIFWSSSNIVSIDINTNWFGKKSVYINGGNQNTNIDPIKYAKQMEDLGAGELLVNSIYKDGTMSGYDIDTINDISNVVNIPLIALGGAGNIEDMKLIFNKTNASAVAAGSMFVYTGIHKAVLINYSNNLS